MAQRIQVGLILNVLDVVIDTPVEIIPGCTLRRPSDLELASFKELLERIDVEHSAEIAFEFDYPKTGENITDWRYMIGFSDKRPFEANSPETTVCPAKLPPKEWRYWVVEEPFGPETTKTRLFDVCVVSRLSDVELPCYCLLLQRPGIPGIVGQGGNPFMLCLPPAKPKVLDGKVFQQIRKTWELYSNLDSAYSPIAVTVRSFYDLGVMRLGNQLYPLGLFGVIESVLTHDPKRSHHSLTHQITTKMRLMNRRFETPLDYGCFSCSDGDDAWKALYSFRSLLAHGRKPDFRDNSLKMLKDQKNVLDFLENATKTLLRHALKEPRLILDLQEC